MKFILTRRQEEAGFQPLEAKVLGFRAYGYSSHLLNLGINPEDFEYIYELAVIIYNATPPEGPFGVDHLIQAAKRFKESKKEYVTFSRPETKGISSCTTCQGSKIEFIYREGKVVGMARDENGTVKKCPDCKEI